MTAAGERFARAVAAKDADALAATLADGIDFQALTPRRHWQAVSPREVADEIVLGMLVRPRAQPSPDWPSSPPARSAAASTWPTGWK